MAVPAFRRDRRVHVPVAEFSFQEFSIPVFEPRRSPDELLTPAKAFPRELRLFLWVACGISTVAWVTALLAALVGKGYPYTWPLAPRGATLIDYRVYFDRFHQLHKAAFFSLEGFPFTYFAPGAVMYRVLYLFGLHGGEAVYFAGVIATLLTGCFLLRRALVQAGLSQASATSYILLSAVTSYPVLFGAERGNLELLLAAGIAVGLAAYCRGWFFGAAMLWGVFGSVKLYPLLLLALFFSYRQYRALVAGCAAAAVTTLLSLWYIGPTLWEAQAGIQQGARAFIAMCSLTYVAFSWDHSLYSLPKLVLYPLGIDRPHLLAGYMLLAGGTMLVFYLVRGRHMALANQIVILSVCMVLLPPTSFDYTLVQLYGAWAVLSCIAVRAAARGKRVRGLAAAMILLAIVFTPLNLVGPGRSYGGPAKSLVLLALLVLAACRSFTECPAMNPARGQSWDEPFPVPRLET